LGFYLIEINEKNCHCERERSNPGFIVPRQDTPTQYKKLKTISKTWVASLSLAMTKIPNSGYTLGSNTNSRVGEDDNLAFVSSSGTDSQYVSFINEAINIPSATPRGITLNANV